MDSKVTSEMRRASLEAAQDAEVSAVVWAGTLAVGVAVTVGDGVSEIIDRSTIKEVGLGAMVFSTALVARKTAQAYREWRDSPTL